MKPRTKSMVLQKLEALIPRLPSDFAKLPALEYELAKEMKGYAGEKKVDYYLDQPMGEFSILRGVCLRMQNKKFQIDTLVISKYAIYIIEIKNFSGTITFDTILNQFTRDDGEKETGYRHPITQAELQQMRLETWLQERNYHPIPIYFFIAISDPATIIKVIGDASYIGRLVARGEHIPSKILHKEKELRNGGGKRNAIESQKLGRAIWQTSESYDFDVLGKFRVTYEDILPGVRCPSCGLIGMVRSYGKWCCPKCKSTSIHAHVGTLSDFLLLIKPSISNKECRVFLQIKSRAVATRILQKSGLVYQNEGKRWRKPR